MGGWNRCGYICLALWFLLLTACGSSAGGFTTKPAHVMANNAASLQSVQVDIVNSMRSYGFNHDPAINGGLGGLFVNWRYGSYPLQTNVNGTGEMDIPDGRIRHDPLTDLRYLHNLWSYKLYHPDDHSFDGEITRYTPIVQFEFAHSRDERGWLYDVFMDLYALSRVVMYRQIALQLVASYARIYRPSVGTIFKITRSTPLGSYRVDYALEEGCALVEAGTQFRRSEWVDEGLHTIDFVYAHAYIADYHTFPDQVNDVLLANGSVNPLETFYRGAGTADRPNSGGQVRMGTSSQIIIALLNAFRIVHKQVLLSRAIDLLNGFTAEENILGLWDGTYGGYFYGLSFSGASPAHPGQAVVDRKRKEAGRQAFMLQAFHLANVLTAHRYAAMEDRMLEVALRHIYQPSIHGVPYVVNADWSFQKFRNGTLDDMVTTEAMGIELESLLAVSH